jgi:hypothetical protein
MEFEEDGAERAARGAVEEEFHGEERDDWVVGRA